MSPQQGINNLIRSAVVHSQVRSLLVNGYPSDALKLAKQLNPEERFDVDGSDLKGLGSIQADDLKTFADVCIKIGLVHKDRKG